MAAKKKVAKHAEPKADLVSHEDDRMRYAVMDKKVPRYNAEGVLLNPGDFHVSPEGLLKPKG